MRLTQHLDDLFGGVSTRPQTQRLPSQADEQINALALSRLLSRRPPLEHVVRLMTDTTGYEDAFVEEIRLSDDEQYIVLVVNGDLKVFDANTGVAATVHFPDGKDYLDDVSAGFRSLTIGGSTVLVNRAITVQKGTTQQDDFGAEALVCCRQGDYLTRYAITLSGTTVSHTTSAASAGRDKITTDFIATALYNALVANTYLSGTFTFTRYGSTIHIRHISGGEFTLYTNDGLADLGLVAIKEKVQRFSELPLKAAPDFTVEVVGDADTQFDNYFVRYTESGSPNESGTWVEVAQPGSIVDFDTSTMPHVLEHLGALADSIEAYQALPGPTISLGAGSDTRITIDDNVQWPPGSYVTLVIDDIANTFTYTNETSGFVTSAVMTAGLKALIEAHVDYTTTTITTTSFDVAGAGSVGWPAAGYDRTRRIASPSLSMTTDEHVGRTIRNVTDGSSAVIASNTAVSIYTSAALSGGADNAFQPGDLCEIIGVGEYFVFKRAPWAERSAGSLETVPFPSVIERTINNVFESHGRLGLLSGPNVVMSRPGTENLYNLFRSTATQPLADDPIDIRSALPQSPDFQSATPWETGLLLQSDSRWFLMEGNPVWAYNTVALRQVANHQNVTTVPPARLGESVFFTSLRNTAPVVWEMRKRGEEQLVEPLDITRHLPGYLTGTPVELRAEDTYGMILLRTNTASNKLWVYVGNDFGAQREQAAWSLWEFHEGFEIIAVIPEQGKLTIVSRDLSGIHLGKITLDPAGNPGFTLGTHAVFLDRLMSSEHAEITVSYGAGRTTWILPYNVTNGNINEVLAVGIVEDDGTVTTLDAYGGPAENLIHADGDYSADLSIVGVRYTTRFRPSRIYRRAENGMPDVRGRLMLSYVTLHYESSTNIRTEVRDSRREWLADGSHDALASGGLKVRPNRVTVLAEDVAEDGKVRFHIGAHSEVVEIDLVTDEIGPMSLSSIEWEGEVHDRRGSR